MHSRDTPLPQSQRAARVHAQRQLEPHAAAPHFAPIQRRRPCANPCPLWYTTAHLHTTRTDTMCVYACEVEEGEGEEPCGRTHTLANTHASMYVFVSWHRIAATELAPPWACRSVTHHGLQRKCKCKRRSVCVSVCVCECGPPRPCLPSAPVAVDTHLTKKWLLIVIL